VDCRWHCHALDHARVQRGELRLVGQLTVPQQIGDLLERVLLGETLRIMAAIDEAPVLPVDQRDRSAAERDSLEAGSRQIQRSCHGREV
jgi:hypothetical protein